MKTSKKRARLGSPEESSPLESFATKSPQPFDEPSPSFNAVSSFRNVSACNRCRQRKNRCDQKLPACSSCTKAGARCVGFDQITKREVPRTYVYYLESRVTYLESLLKKHDIEFATSKEFDLGARPTTLNQTNAPSEGGESSVAASNGATGRGHKASGQGSREDWEKEHDEANKLNKLVANIGMVSVEGASDPRFLGSTSGISFARVVFAAVRSSISSTASEKGGARPLKSGSSGNGPAGPAGSSGTSMRDSFFGLHTKPTFKQAPFPDRELGKSLVDLYFEHANPQIPILHREEFMVLFERAYAKERRRSSRELYLLNIVFAIGAGIIYEGSSAARSRESTASPKSGDPDKNQKKQKDSEQKQPEEYHSSAMMHLESCLESGSTNDGSEGFNSGLIELQAVLLLAGFALLRPVAPGLWYIVGVAVRLAVDLGLHFEGGLAVDGSGDNFGVAKTEDIVMETSSSLLEGYMLDEKGRGKREWVRDLRRRLWWCVYSFDRLVSICVGRPFGIADQAVTTEFPSMLDDAEITIMGFKTSPDTFHGPSYKRVSYHYFRLRLLQSEILQVLQYRQSQMAHAAHKSRCNHYMHTKLSSPFLQGFEGFHDWRRDIDRRLWEWKESAPLQEDTTVKFSVKFLELNYWQAVIMLYRQSLSIPPSLAGGMSPSEEVSSPLSPNMDDCEDDEEVFLKVAQAGQRVLKLYFHLHRVHLVNYTYLATVHLFMAGIAFLYAIWHSETVRSWLTLDDVDFTVLSATSVLEDLADKCPPAEACRDAFDRMSKATVKMCLTTTGFGSRNSRPPPNDVKPPTPVPRRFDTSDFSSSPQPRIEESSSRPPIQFDTNLRDLFPEQSQDGRPFESNVVRWQTPLTPLDDLFSSVNHPTLPTYFQQDRNDAAHQGFHPHEAESNIEHNPDSVPGAAAMYAGNSGVMPFDTSLYDLRANVDDTTAMQPDYLTNNNELKNENLFVYGNDPSHRLDLGVMDDGQYNWGNGTQFDLFDGFFFGNAGSYSSGMG